MMSSATLSCKSEQRRHAVRQAEGLNGLDYVEVNGRSLTVFFLGKAPEEVALAEVRIEGGRRIRDIKPVRISIQRQEDPDLDDCMTITMDKEGDFSTYTLCLIEVDENGRPTGNPRPDFDPRYACIEFNFRLDCPTGFDCKTEDVCPPPEWDEPDISYLAKDYASFRRLILDRLALIMPDWKERHVPDIGITLVEILAYAADYLSYYQDAVATEAYLGTARQRISVRRHARLVDYQMHEGCNARAFVHVATHAGDSDLPTGQIAFITGLEQFQIEPGKLLTWADLDDVSPRHYEVFAPLVAEPEQVVRLYQAHNEIALYTWGDAKCCLPRGATSVTLVDGSPPESSLIENVEPEDEEETAGQQKRHRKKKERPPEPPTGQRALNLQVGDFLLFEEVFGPKTGRPADADPEHRHVVRLTRVEASEDPLTGQPLLEIGWDEADALPFPLCISVVGPPPNCELLTNVSVARGNVLLADHGRFVSEPEGDPWQVPTATTDISCEGQERPSEIKRLPGRFRPLLARRPVTFSQPYPAERPAAGALRQDPRQAAPWIQLESQQPDEPDAPLLAWESRHDLLASGARDPHFVAEIDNDGAAHLRFGDGELGRRPAAGETFTARYRIGRGTAGNVGAEAIRHVLLTQVIDGVDWRPRNPLPAEGGTDPEPLDEVRRFAPVAFRHQLRRAITAADYAAIVMRDFAAQVQRATAKLRWNGSWYEVLLAIDPLGGGPANPDLLQALTGHLYRYRRTGHDLVVREARYVPLDLSLRVCVRHGYLRGHVKAAVKQLFSNRRLPNGRFGFFHPDNLTFGGDVHLSRIVAAAQTVQGVDSVSVVRMERLFEGPNLEIERGILPLGPLEIARLDNDPSLPEIGRLELVMEGGR
jgi:hypothetical protein